MLREIAGIAYHLSYKNVKNINLRVRKDLAIIVSAHKRVPLEQIDRFVASKASWIIATQQKLSHRQIMRSKNIHYSDEECLDLFRRIADQYYPQFSTYIKEKPTIKTRLMKSCWGVCHPRKNYITLNKTLMNKPLAAIEYVVMHEYVHFLHGNHQKGFYAELEKRMPDFKERKKLLILISN